MSQPGCGSMWSPESTKSLRCTHLGVQLNRWLLTIAGVVALLSLSVWQSNASGQDVSAEEEIGSIASSSFLASLLIASLCYSAARLISRSPTSGFAISAFAWWLCLVHPLVWLAYHSSIIWSLIAVIVLVSGGCLELRAMRAAKGSGAIQGSMDPSPP